MDTKARVIRWILLLQEFNLEIKDKWGAEILAADHLFHVEKLNLETLKEKDINDSFPEEHLYSINEIKESKILWFTDFINYLVSKVLPKDLNY